MTASKLEHIGRTRRLPVGSEVTVLGMTGKYTVAGQDDSALITLRSSRGLVLRVGRLAVHLDGETE